MDNKSIKKIKKKGTKKRLETIIEEEEPIKPILICDGKCDKCINITKCI
jgi:hypothetical protein